MSDNFLIPLVSYIDERGFFRELLRASVLPDTFAQLSHSRMYQGTIKAWHYHRNQVDYWYIVSGVILAAICKLDADCHQSGDIHEWLLGEGQENVILRIPPMYAHGLKVLQGPADMIYMTSQEYDGTDEGRLHYQALNYDWEKKIIT